MATKKRRAEPWRIFFIERFLPEWWNDFKTRLVGNVLGVVLALLILWAQFHLGVVTLSSIHGRILSVIEPYAALLAVFVLYHAARAPWLISNRHLDSIKEVENSNALLRDELEDTRKIPPVIDVAIRELYRKPVNSGKDGNAKDGYQWDIFLAARIELKAPLTLSIAQYKMTLSLHGNAIPIEAVHDLDKRQLDIWKPSGELAHAELTPLSTALKSGEPVEGWLHFLSPQATYKTLDESTVRLIADTGRGAAYKEWNPSPALWNPENKQFHFKT